VRGKAKVASISNELDHPLITLTSSEYLQALKWTLKTQDSIFVGGSPQGSRIMLYNTESELREYQETRWLKWEGHSRE
jgi:hypothetical protein